MSRADAAAIAEGLDRAIDELLVARLALCPLPPALPDSGLDAALDQASEYQEARRAFQAALNGLEGHGAPQTHASVLAVQDGLDILVGQAAWVAWQLGVRGRAA